MGSPSTKPPSWLKPASVWLPSQKGLVFDAPQRQCAARVIVGALASYLSARRASSVDPIESLRGG